jgi:galactose-1-phosphate uridylyltransferase
MADIELHRVQDTIRFHSPLKGGELDEHTLETRTDPLTGHKSVLNTGLEGKAQILFPDTDWDYLRQRAEETQSACFLCPGNWRDNVPRYESGFLEDGMLERGDVALFPNLFPVGPYHAVVRIGDKHLRTLDELPAELLQQAFQVSVEFLQRCFEYDPRMRYVTINANYLFPAGASLIHPHFQVIAAATPSTHHQLLLDRSLEYARRTGSCYWSDLLSLEEEKGERWIGRTGSCSWMSAFSPLGYNEVQAVFPEHQSIEGWGEREAGDLARGMERILVRYHEMALSTFNFSLFSGPLGEDCPEFRCFFRMMNRQNVVPHHRTDDYFFQKVMKNELILHRPEKLAPWMAEDFG